MPQTSEEAPAGTGHYPRVNVDDCVDWPQLVRQVQDGCGRAVIASEGETGCVLISQEELRSLESALEILGESDHLRQLGDTISSLLRTAELPHPPAELTERFGT